MTGFIRLFGGALGALIAVVLAGGAHIPQLDDVRVLNLNLLANALKPAFLPGDPLTVKVIQQGNEPGQGLAYLDDGTMIVVEGGGTMIDTEVEVTVVRVLQTVAGRMVFAQPRV